MTFRHSKGDFWIQRRLSPSNPKQHHEKIFSKVANILAPFGLAG
jgi:hypothetical protein